MHVVFIPYGIKEKVDLLLRDMQCQKFQLRCWKEGQQDRSIWIQGSLRVLPFGVYEYVFPREYLDHVLTTLNFHEVQYPQYQGFKLKTALTFLRKFLMAKKAPKEFKRDQSCIWIKEHVAIIPIGIREDGNIVEPAGELVGFTHEAI